MTFPYTSDWLYLFFYERNKRSMVHIAHFSTGVLKQVKPYPKLNCCLVWINFSQFKILTRKIFHIIIHLRRGIKPFLLSFTVKIDQLFFEKFIKRVIVSYFEIYQLVNFNQTWHKVCLSKRGFILFKQEQRTFRGKMIGLLKTNAHIILHTQFSQEPRGKFQFLSEEIFQRAIPLSI